LLKKTLALPTGFLSTLLITFPLTLICEKAENGISNNRHK